MEDFDIRIHQERQNPGFVNSYHFTRDQANIDQADPGERATTPSTYLQPTVTSSSQTNSSSAGGASMAPYRKPAQVRADSQSKRKRRRQNEQWEREQYQAQASAPTRLPTVYSPQQGHHSSSQHHGSDSQGWQAEEGMELEEFPGPVSPPRAARTNSPREHRGSRSGGQRSRRRRARNDSGCCVAM